MTQHRIPQMNDATAPMLAIDTATSHGGVAIGRAGEVLAEVVISQTARHSELLLSAIDFALHAAGIDRTELGGVVVGAGPGSFTGVRIAAATARGIAAALDVPLHAYSSLAALAAAAGRGASPVCAMFDARRGEVYAGCYAFEDAHIRTLLAPVAAPIGVVLESLELQSHSQSQSQIDVSFVGDGAHAYAAQLPRAAVPLALVHLVASALLWLAHTYPGAGVAAGEESSHFEPLYVRGSGAERGLSV
jgi:tRNA threonylcarbamoyladenosine biosynthesis protein TsaB